MFYLVLMGPIALSAAEVVNEGAVIDIPEADAEPLVRYGILRLMDPQPEAEAEEPPVEPPAEEPPVVETAAQRKKRLAEEAEAARLAAEEEARLAAEEAAKNEGQTT